MRNVLVNALGVTNQSGVSVLTSHLEALVGAFEGRCRFHVLTRRDDASGLRDCFGDRVAWRFAPAATARWLCRSCWEWIHLPRLASECRADLYFSPSGMAARRLTTVQVILCMNPWALVPEARRDRDALKAWLQRRAYRRTMRTAAAMVFISRFMQAAYRRNAGHQERRGVVVYQAADDATRRRAEHWRNKPRNAGRILCVSAMGPHKNVESLLRAFARLDPCASLELVGSWPDALYERKIRKLKDELNLSARVHFAGFVSREDLERRYAESQVFCLMSRCESFGIPAIEAQLFGTPVVCSNVCAVPEICGDGGVFLAPDNVDGIAAALGRLLNDDDEWQRLSALARHNAEKYTCNNCSQTLVDLFAEMLPPPRGETRQLPLSVVILCRNEVMNLERCIHALRKVSDIVVVDDGSTDGSRELARSLGVRVVEHPFVSFAEQRNWAMDHAGLACDWVLHLDADEVMTPAALAEVNRALPVLRSAQFGCIARKIMLDGRWLRFSADYPVYVPRLVHRLGRRFRMRGHGDIIAAPEDSAHYLRAPMLHFAFSKGWAEWRQRHRRYAAAEADRIRDGLAVFTWQDLLVRNRSRRRSALRALSYRLVGRPVLRFLYAYVFRLGFLDGRPGLAFCRAMSEYEAMIADALKRGR